MIKLCPLFLKYFSDERQLLLVFTTIHVQAGTLTGLDLGQLVFWISSDYQSVIRQIKPHPPSPEQTAEGRFTVRRGRGSEAPQTPAAGKTLTSHRRADAVQVSDVRVGGVHLQQVLLHLAVAVVTELQHADRGDDEEDEEEGGRHPVGRLEICN